MYKEEVHIPVWLYTPIERDMEPNGKWNEAKQKVAEGIVHNMKQHSEWWYWDEKVMTTLFTRYKEDNPHMYGSDTGHKASMRI